MPTPRRPSSTLRKTHERSFEANASSAGLKVLLPLTGIRWFFDTGDEPLQRVPMMEPTRGTSDHVANLITQSETVADLLERLGN